MKILRFVLPVLALLAYAGVALAQPANLNQPSQSNLNLPGSPYAQGTWTPAIGASTTDPTITSYDTQVGTYEVNGRQITVRFNVGYTTSTVSPVGNLRITGLPFTSTTTSNDTGICTIANYNTLTLASGFNQVSAIISPNSTTIVIQQNGSTKVPTVINGNANIVTPVNLTGSCVYHVGP